MNIKVGDYVTLKPWEEVKDGDTLGIGESVWNDISKNPRKVIGIDYDSKCIPPLAYLIEDETDEDGWYILESAVESVRRDFK